jgi:peptide/nickel transport system permease protein
VQSADEEQAPLLLLGADSYGRDVFSRMLFGARVSLGLAIVAAFGALALGAILGGIAGYAGGGSDATVMAASDFVLVLPVMYVVLALRAVLPLVLSASQVFLLVATIFAVIGAPLVARGVRALVRRERMLDYAVAAESLGASRARVLFRHLLPAARGFLAVQATVLVPGFIVSEATLSYVGLGFPDLVPSWGTMLTEAATLASLSDFPWLLSPAVAMFAVVLGLNLLADRRGLPRA